jgi:hypothetical protein
MLATVSYHENQRFGTNSLVPLSCKCLSEMPSFIGSRSRRTWSAKVCRRARKSTPHQRIHGCDIPSPVVLSASETNLELTCCASNTRFPVNRKTCHSSRSQGFADKTRSSRRVAHFPFVDYGYFLSSAGPRVLLSSTLLRHANHTLPLLQMNELETSCVGTLTW